LLVDDLGVDAFVVFFYPLEVFVVLNFVGCMDWGWASSSHAAVILSCGVLIWPLKCEIRAFTLESAPLLAVSILRARLSGGFHCGNLLLRRAVLDIEKMLLFLRSRATFNVLKTGLRVAFLASVAVQPRIRVDLDPGASFPTHLARFGGIMVVLWHIMGLFDVFLRIVWPQCLFHQLLSHRVCLLYLFQRSRPRHENRTIALQTDINP
jgi:hypothetical protein